MKSEIRRRRIVTSINDWVWGGQSGPASAFDDILGWWRADTFTGTSPNVVLTDKSVNGNNMTQAAGTLTPGTAANGQSRMVGNATASLTSALTVQSWPFTSITVALRANNATMGFFGHTGASGFNTLWYGFEASNSFRIYNSNSTANTTAEAGTTSCYTARIGYGSRVSILNGVVQADQILSTIVRSSAVTTTIGTEYRGLNGEWQETLVWNRVLTLAELDEVHTYINTRYGLSIPLWSGYTATPTIWLGGQSNASGRGDRGASDANVPAEYDQALTGVNVWNGTVSSLVGDAFGTLNINSDNQMLGENGTASLAQTYFGPELTMTKEYIDRVGGAVYLSKFAQGSSYLNFHSGGAFWHPTSGGLVQNNSTRLYGTAMRNWWKAMAIHQAAGRRPNIIGIVWFQGEQDATVQAYADAYSSNGQTLFAELQKELGFDVTLKKFICRIHINGSETYEATLRTQQSLLVASLTNAVLVDTDSYGTRIGDGVHLSFQGQLDLGTYLAGQL